MGREQKEGEKKRKKRLLQGKNFLSKKKGESRSKAETLDQAEAIIHVGEKRSRSPLVKSPTSILLGRQTVNRLALFSHYQEKRREKQA